MFRAAEVVVVNKIDLLPHLDFDLGIFLSNLEAVNPGRAGDPGERTHGQGRRRVVFVADRMSHTRLGGVRPSSTSQTP